MSASDPLSDAQRARRDWMGLLARAAPADLAALMPPDLPDIAWLRPPEIGSVMVQGRMGGTGGPFNLGEMTLTRCALRLVEIAGAAPAQGPGGNAPAGVVGLAHVQGRDQTHARNAALVDAWMQGPDAADIRARILTPLAQREAARRATLHAEAAATKVDFFTLVRGESE